MLHIVKTEPVRKRPTRAPRVPRTEYRPGVVLAPSLARAQGDAQTLVDRATLALQEMMTQTVSQDPRNALQRARAVMICPRRLMRPWIMVGAIGTRVISW